VIKIAYLQWFFIFNCYLPTTIFKVFKFLTSYGFKVCYCDVQVPICNEVDCYIELHWCFFVNFFNPQWQIGICIFDSIIFLFGCSRCFEFLMFYIVFKTWCHAVFNENNHQWWALQRSSHHYRYTTHWCFLHELDQDWWQRSIHFSQYFLGFFFVICIFKFAIMFWMTLMCIMHCEWFWHASCNRLVCAILHIHKV
jgi:hypothetical protein